MKHSILATCLLCLSSIANAEKITVLTEQLYPLSFTEKKGDTKIIGGYATDLVRAVLDISGFEYEISMIPWSRILTTLENKKNILAYSITRTQDREEKFFWVGRIIPMKISLFGLSRNKSKLPTSIEEAKNFRIAVKRASVVDNYLKSKEFTRTIEIKSQDKYLILLERDRFDLFPMLNFAVPPLALRENRNSEDYYAAVPLTALAKELFIALSSKSSPDMQEKLKQAYSKVKKSGVYTEIMAPLLLNAEQPH